MFRGVVIHSVPNIRLSVLGTDGIGKHSSVPNVSMYFDVSKREMTMLRDESGIRIMVNLRIRTFDSCDPSRTNLFWLSGYASSRIIDHLHASQ